MANIPVLKENVSAQAVTGTVDRSGVLKEEQRGISDFGNFLQKTIKQGAEIVDTKIYASESSKAQGELLDFMSESKGEKMKADYFKANKGNMVGFATHRAKKNMDNMERRLSNISHPKARKELEKSMAFQAQKNLIADLGDENRVVEAQTKQKIDARNQVLALEISEMKLGTDTEQYQVALAKGLSAINKDVENGLISPEKGLKLQRDTLDMAATTRVRALVEGGNPLEAMKSAKKIMWGSEAAQKRGIGYLVDKNLNGKKKGYDALVLQNNMRKQNIISQNLDLDAEINNLMDSDLGMNEKLAKSRSLKTKYTGKYSNSKQAKLIENANYRISRGAVTKALSQVRSINFDETDTKAFHRAHEKLRAIRDNDTIPHKVQKEASNAMKEIVRKQKVHEALVEKKAYDPLKKGSGWQKLQHKKIMAQLTETPKYQDIAVEAKVGVYKLLADGKNKSYVGVKDKDDKDSETRPFRMKADRALQIYKGDPAKLDKMILWEIKNKRPSLNNKELRKVFKQFKTSFDEYRDNVDNFETKEKAILEQYKGF